MTGEDKMENNTNASVNKSMTFDDKQRMEDVLISQKHITGVYNTFLNEAVNPDVKSCLNNILNEEHDIQNQIFGQMSQKGWYQMETAEDAKVNKEKQKYSAKTMS